MLGYLYLSSFCFAISFYSKETYMDLQGRFHYSYSYIVVCFYSGCTRLPGQPDSTSDQKVVFYVEYSGLSEPSE